MVMNVKPVPTLDGRINDIRMHTAEIVNNHRAQRFVLRKGK